MSPWTICLSLSVSLFDLEGIAGALHNEKDGSGQAEGVARPIANMSPFFRTFAPPPPPLVVCRQIEVCRFFLSVGT